MRGEMKYQDINKAREANKGKVIVWYPFSLGGQLADRGMWCAEKNGVVDDYDKQTRLIADNFHKGEQVVVFTLHRNGQVTAVDIIDA